MDPEEMTLVQLVRREYNMRVNERRLYPAGGKSYAFRSPSGLAPHSACSQMKDTTEDNPRAFTELHQLMRATIIVNILSESLRVEPEVDILWPILLLLRAQRSTLYGDLNYVVDLVLKDKYPYILNDLQAEMGFAKDFLEQRRLPTRFLYAFKLEDIKAVLEIPDAPFAVPTPPPKPSIDIKDFAPNFEPPIVPDTTIDLSDKVSQDLSASGPNLQSAAEAAMKRSDSNTAEEAAEHPVVRGAPLSLDQSPSPSEKCQPKEDSVIPRSSEAPEAANAEETFTASTLPFPSIESKVNVVTTNAANMTLSDSIEPEFNFEAADAATAMDIDAVGRRFRSQVEPEVDREASITDPVRDEVDKEAIKPNEKDEDWFEELPSPILRGMDLSMQPSLAPESSYDTSFADTVRNDERFEDLFPDQEKPPSSEPPGHQGQASDAESSTQNGVARPSEKITAAIDFTDIFSELADQQTMLKYNLVLNHLLGLGEEIREATLRESQGTSMRGGEDVNIDIELCDRMDIVGEETPQNSSGLSFRFAELLPAVNNTTPVGSPQFLSGYFPRSLRSLPPRFALPRRPSSGDRYGIEPSTLQGGLNSSPATIAASDPDPSPGLLLPFTRPSQPFKQRTSSRKGMPLARMTMNGNGTPRRVRHQEPPSSGATIPMVDSNPSPGILLQRNQQTPHRRQQARRRQNPAASPLKHVTTSHQPSKMCSSSSSSSSSSSQSSTPEPPVPRSNFLSKHSSAPPLAAFRFRPDSSNKPLPETTLVVSNSGRDTGLASVRTTKPSRAQKSKKNSKDLRLSSASLENLGTVLPISAPGYGNIRLPDRKAIESGPRTAPLPSRLLVEAWAAEQRAKAIANRSSVAPVVSNGNSGFHPMHPMMLPPLRAGPASAPPTPRKKTILTKKSPEESNNGGKCVEQISRRWRGGGKNMDLVRKLSAGSLEREAMLTGVDLPRLPAPDPSSTHDSRGESGAPAPDVASGADNSASNPQRVGAATGENGAFGGEDHGEQTADDGASQFDSLGPVSSGGSSGDEEFARQQQLDKEAEQQRQAVPDYAPFPPYPPWHNANRESASVHTTPAPKRHYSSFSIIAAGEIQFDSPSVRSALSPFRPPRPPGEETTPGITAPPIRMGRKRSLSQYLEDSESVGDVGAGGGGAEDVARWAVKREEVE
ncbi:hypothetical protein BKA80DRAFT_307325 [Phyllosticta citrichinensis]